MITKKQMDNLTGEDILENNLDMLNELAMMVAKIDYLVDNPAWAKNLYTHLLKE